MPAVHLSKLTPTAFLDRTAAVLPDRVGVIDGSLRRTWSELQDRSRRLATALQAAGIGHGERVAFLAPNTAELLEAHFGVPAAGAVLVAVNSRLLEDEVAFILKHSGSRLLVVDFELEELGSAAARSAGVERVLVAGEGSGSYEAFLESAPPGPPEPRLGDEDETISINYTSGTTGRPKGVMYTHRGAYLNALAESHHSKLDARSVYLWTLPMFHCNGWCFPWAVTAAAATHVCLRQVEPAAVWRLIEEEGVTHLCGAPTVLVMLASDPAAHPLERPLLATTAAAPPPPAVIARMEALGFEVNHVYGLTETYGPISICEWDPAWDEEDGEERARLRARQGVGMLTADALRVVDVSCTRTATSSCVTGRRTSSSREGRTSRPSRSNGCSCATRTSSTWRSSPGPTRSGASARGPSSRSSPAPSSPSTSSSPSRVDSCRDSRPRRTSSRRPATELHRQGPQDRTARSGTREHRHALEHLPVASESP